MPKTIRLFLKTAPRCRSAEVALQLGSMNDMTQRLFDEDLAGVTKHELHWQAAPGHNTIGMLLAHLAVVEAFWTQVGVERLEAPDVSRVIGIDMDDDGMPLPADGAPPAALASKPLRWFRSLLETSRRHVTSKWGRVTDEQLTERVTRTRKNGERVISDPRWVLYHMVEHFAGHQGQTLLIRHQYRDARAGR